MSQCAYRSFRLARFTYLRCCFQFVRSLSLAILALWTVSASDVLDLAPPTLPFSRVFCVCFSFYLLLILLLFHLFSGGRNAYVDRARCFKCHTNLATGQENVLPPGIAHEVLIAEPLSPQDIHAAPTDPHSEPTVNPVQSSNVFDDEVADIAQVHCDSELFGFELSTSSPSVNVRGNLSSNFEFWKRIGTPSFILNVIEKGIFVTVRQFSGTRGFQKQQIVSLTCRVCWRGYSRLSWVRNEF